MKQIEKKVLKICKQLYEIGVNDGKNKLVYFPLPPQFYADKITKALQDTREEEIKDFLSKMLGDRCKAHGEVSYCVTCEMWELYDDYKLTKNK